MTEETVYTISGKNVTTLYGKRYVRIAGNEKVDEEVKEEEEKEGEEDALTDVEVEDSGCCSCSQSRILFLGGLFAVIMGVSTVLLEFLAFDMGREEKQLDDTNKTYWRALVGFLAIVRSVLFLNILLLAATVKRNAIFVYPWLPKYHAYVIVTCVCTHATDAAIFFLYPDSTPLSWVDPAVLVLNYVATLHCLLEMYRQYTNGSMDCSDRALDTSAAADVFDMEDVDGYDRLKICNNNRGSIRTGLPDNYYEFSLL